jgi:hypothetical protein
MQRKFGRKSPGLLLFSISLARIVPHAEKRKGAIRKMAAGYVIN